MSNWRVGTDYTRDAENVYEALSFRFHCESPEQAARIAGLLNAGEADRKRLLGLRETFAWLYQWAGSANASASILDNLSALAQGEPLSHEWKYPTMDDEGPSCIEALRAARQLLSNVERTHPSVTTRKNSRDILAQIDAAISSASSSEKEK